MSEWESYLTDHEQAVSRGEFGEPRAMREWAAIQKRAVARMEKSQMANAVSRFGSWVSWLTESERRDLLRLADQEPQERWVEHYREIALARERVMRVGFRALFAGVRGGVSRLAHVGGFGRKPPVEIDPATGRPYGEIIWEPERPAPGFEIPREYAPPRPEPWKEPYRGPGYPVGQPSLPLAPVAPSGAELVGEVELISRGEVGTRKPGFAGRPIRK